MFKKSRGRPLIRAIHNKRLFDSENFSVFAKFAFQNKRPLLKKIKRSKIFAKKELAPFFTGRPSEEGVVFRGIQSLF